MSAERFVDQAENPIPPQSTWDTLSVNQLIDVRNQLQTKAYEFRNVPQIASVLKRSIDQLSKLINPDQSL